MGGVLGGFFWDGDNMVCGICIFKRKSQNKQNGVLPLFTLYAVDELCDVFLLRNSGYECGMRNDE
jgi:hypothetical protein